MMAAVTEALQNLGSGCSAQVVFVYYRVRELCVCIIEYANVVKCTLVYVYVLPMLSSTPQPTLFYPSPLSVSPHTHTMIFFFNT